MNKIIRSFLIELSWYIYQQKDGISVEEFITILNVCSILTTNPHYKVRLDSFRYELKKNRNRDPTLQQRYLNNVTSHLVYTYFVNH